jgi:hypothetical protein
MTTVYNLMVNEIMDASTTMVKVVAHKHHVWKMMDLNLSQEISNPGCLPPGR